MPNIPRHILPALSGRPRAALLITLAATTTPLGAQQATDLAIDHVAVVDVVAGRILPDQRVLVRGDTIIAVEPASPIAPAATTIIDGRGRYLVPGLWDMHAHLRANGVPEWISTDWIMPLLLANGVTGVRDMNSDCENERQGPVCLDQMRTWQAAIAAGTMPGPRILALSSFQLNPPWDFEATTEQADAVVQRLAERGVDLLKIYTRMSPATLQAIAAAARRERLPIAGHVPLRVTITEASDAGFVSVEHARDFLFDCYPGTAAFRANARSQSPPTAAMRDMIDHHDPSRCAAIFRTMVANGTWYVPTHVTRRMDAFADDSTYRHDPRNRYVPPMVLDGWNRDADAMVALDSSAAGRRAFMDFYRKGLEITLAAHRAGVGIMVGTDGGDSFVYPGTAVHDELGELVRAGLSPLEALRAATIRPAEFLGLADTHGSIRAGRRADLLLLDADPLADIANIRQIRGVVFRGEFLDRAHLDALLAGAEATAHRPLGADPGA